MIAAGGGLLFAAPGSENEAAADPAAVDLYVAHLSDTVPRSPTAELAKPPPEDSKLAKAAARADRAEPIVGGVLSIAR